MCIRVNLTVYDSQWKKHDDYYFCDADDLSTLYLMIAEDYPKYKEIIIKEIKLEF